MRESTRAARVLLRNVDIEVDDDVDVDGEMDSEEKMRVTGLAADSSRIG